MTRISIVCAAVSALAVLILSASSASAGSVTVHTNVPNVTVKPQALKLNNAIISHGSGAGAVNSKNFFKNDVAGAHYKNVQLSDKKSGADPNAGGKPYLRYKFGTVFTTQQKWAPGGGAPSEGAQINPNAMTLPPR